MLAQSKTEWAYNMQRGHLLVQAGHFQRGSCQFASFPHRHPVTSHYLILFNASYTSVKESSMISFLAHLNRMESAEDTYTRGHLAGWRASSAGLVITASFHLPRRQSKHQERSRSFLVLLSLHRLNATDFKAGPRLVILSHSVV